MFSQKRKTRNVHCGGADAPSRLPLWLHGYHALAKLEAAHLNVLNFTKDGRHAKMARRGPARCVSTGGGQNCCHVPPPASSLTAWKVPLSWEHCHHWAFPLPFAFVTPAALRCAVRVLCPSCVRSFFSASLLNWGFCQGTRP